MRGPAQGCSALLCCPATHQGHGRTNESRRRRFPDVLHDAQAIVRLRITWLARNRFDEAVRSFVKALLLQQQASQVVVGSGILGFKAHRFFELEHRLSTVRIRHRGSREHCEPRGLRRPGSSVFSSPAMSSRSISGKVTVEDLPVALGSAARPEATGRHLRVGRLTIDDPLGWTAGRTLADELS